MSKQINIFLSYSPEANGVIRSGKGVSPRPHLDHDLYNKHMEARCTECSSIPENFRQYIDAFAESVIIRLYNALIQDVFER